MHPTTKSQTKIIEQKPQQTQTTKANLEPSMNLLMFGFTMQEAGCRANVMVWVQKG